MPKGLKPVKRRLATGQSKIYWYHRATGKALKHDPESVDGLLEVKALDGEAEARKAVLGAPSGSFAALWIAYTDRTNTKWTDLRPRTRSDYQAVRDWIGDAADLVMVRAITGEDVLALKAKAAAEKGRRFGKYVLQVVRLVLEWGKANKWLTINPAMGIKEPRRPRKGKKANRPWALYELEAFATDCPRQLLVPFVLGFFAAMREGDALVVTWSAYTGFLLRWIASKNHEECTVEVSGVFKAILDKAKAQRGRSVQIAVTSFGTPWTESGFRASFFKRVRALREAGAVQPGLTFHGLRATIGTMARDNNESEFRVAAAIGDRSTAMAEVYGREADRISAQHEVLTGVQKRFENSDWQLADKRAGKRVTKPDGKNT